MHRANTKTKQKQKQKTTETKKRKNNTENKNDDNTYTTKKPEGVPRYYQQYREARDTENIVHKDKQCTEN